MVFFLIYWVTRVLHVGQVMCYICCFLVEVSECVLMK